MATYQVGADGKAQKGLSAGDEVVTAGGTYKITGVNDDGSYVSERVSDTTTKNYTGTYANAPSSEYVAKGSYNDANLSAADAQKIDALKQQYEAAKAQGNQAGMNAAHSSAEAIRSGYGYSGGADGSEYYGLQMQEGAVPQTGLPTYKANADQVNAVQDAAKEAALAALKSAYDTSKLEAEQAMEKISPIYQQKRNAAAVGSEREKMAFNEYAAASGLNSGTGGQAMLAFSNQLQGQLNDLNIAEANAITEAQNQITKLTMEYQNSIAEAVANNEYERAAALLEEFKLQAQSVVDVAQSQASLNLQTASHNTGIKNDERAWLEQQAATLAQYGDFSGYLALGYTNDQIEQMRAVWKAANPKIAWALG